jgi:hypothetical protein
LISVLDRFRDLDDRHLSKLRWRRHTADAAEAAVVRAPCHGPSDSAPGRACTVQRLPVGHADVARASGGRAQRRRLHQNGHAVQRNTCRTTYTWHGAYTCRTTHVPRTAPATQTLPVACEHRTPRWTCVAPASPSTGPRRRAPRRRSARSSARASIPASRCAQ